MAGEVKNRRHSAEFRVQVARRMLGGESVMAISRQYGLARSMMYRWRAAYQSEGPAGLTRAIGRSPKGLRQRAPATVEEQLRQQVAELERKVGQQAVEMDFFRRVLQRVKELPRARRGGGDACTRKSGDARSGKTN